MSSRRKGGRRRGQRNKPQDIWRPVPQLPDPAPVVPATDPGMMLRSLGDPPLQGQGAKAEYSFELVARRSSALAQAIAHSAGLLADPPADT